MAPAVLNVIHMGDLFCAGNTGFTASTDSRSGRFNGLPNQIEAVTASKPQVHRP